MMKTVERYLIHFGGIGLIVWAIGMGLLYMDKTLWHIGMIVCWTLAICIYVFPMAWITSKMAEAVDRKVPKSSPDLLEQMDAVFLKNDHKKRVKIQEGNVTRYTFANPYRAWLAGDITVTDHGEELIVHAPKYYEGKWNIHE